MTERIIARRDDGGEIDDVAVETPKWFRAERMDTGHWWVAVSLADGSEITMHFTSTTPIAATFEHEETETR
jgi:hypothetical protein